MINSIIRIIFAVVAGGVGVLILIYNDNTLQKYFKETYIIRDKIQNIHTNLYSLNGEILKNSTFLYYSYDYMDRNINNIDKDLNYLLETKIDILKSYPITYKKIKKFNKLFNSYKEKIHRFQIINSVIKNSMVYIPTLQLKIYKSLDFNKNIDKETIFTVSKITALIFLSKNAQDLDFLSKIKKDMEKLKKTIVLYNNKNKKLLITLEEHLNSFANYFPQFIKTINILLDKNIKEKINNSLKIFDKESQHRLELINKQSWILLLFYLFSISIIIYQIRKIQKENRILKDMKDKLTTALLIDPLTELKNRLAYRAIKSNTPNPCLILLNIDNFKHINEFYGGRTGDKVLQKLSNKIVKISKRLKAKEVFRIGGDDFAVLFSDTNSSVKFDQLVKIYYKYLNQITINIDDIEIELTLSIGASQEKEWLFETADMALKYAKKHTKEKFIIYTPKIDKRKEISQNIKTLKEINSALKESRLIPYFQSIYNIKESKSKKFEALARIELQNGNILTPFKFIQIAKEADLGSDITKSILKSTIEKIKETDYEFSVNISAEELENKKDMEDILEILEKNREFIPKITFEILESEEITDYESVICCIKKLKTYGAKIAIDDFGSGYSNFEKLLKLDIDFLKIDGSLIKNIDKDKNAELIVSTMVRFAKLANIKTVAEFVHSKGVFDKVSEIGFDYAQGYFIAKPEKNI